MPLGLVKLATWNGCFCPSGIGSLLLWTSSNFDRTLLAKAGFLDTISVTQEPPVAAASVMHFRHLLC